MMGNSSNLFYNTDSETQSLHRRVRPSNDQLDSQQAYWHDLEQFLKIELENELRVAVSHWLQGSYKFGTQVRPATKGQQFDIDLGIYVHVGDVDRPPWSSNRLKQSVQRALETYAVSPDTDALHVEPIKEFCSRIVFSEDFHIDVPGYVEDKDDLRLASERKGYIESNPWALYDWWVAAFDSDAERDKARRIVRYLKMWTALKFSADEHAPSSIMLTICVANAFANVDASKIAGDDELLAAVVKQILADLKESEGTVSNPVDPSENLNRLGDAFPLVLSRLQNLSNVATEALQAASIEIAADKWTEVFEHFFPLPDERVVLESATPVELARREKVVPDVLVEVTLPNGKTVTYKNSALNLPHGSKIRFELENYAELPDPSHVIWTVRNEGTQAEAANDLGHFSGRGRSVGPETAEYHGRHFMDVTIRHLGRTIGMRRVPVSVLNRGAVGRARRLFARPR